MVALLATIFFQYSCQPRGSALTVVSRKAMPGEDVPGSSSADRFAYFASVRSRKLWRSHIVLLEPRVVEVQAHVATG